MSAVRQHISMLIMPVCKGHMAGLHKYYKSVASSAAFRKNTPIPTMGNLLEICDRVLERFELVWVCAFARAGLDPVRCEVHSGDMVPTENPRQLLLEILVHTDMFRGKFTQYGDMVIFRTYLLFPAETISTRHSLIIAPSGNLGDFLPLPKPVQTTVELTEHGYEVGVKINDGAPVMLFVCHHVAEKGLFFVGASGDRWGGINAINKIRSEDRAARLHNYTPHVKAALQALANEERHANALLNEPDSRLAKRNRHCPRKRGVQDESQCCFSGSNDRNRTSTKRRHEDPGLLLLLPGYLRIPNLRTGGPFCCRRGFEQCAMRQTHPTTGYVRRGRRERPVRTALDGRWKENRPLKRKGGESYGRGRVST